MMALVIKLTHKATYPSTKLLRSNLSVKKRRRSTVTTTKNNENSKEKGQKNNKEKEKGRDFDRGKSPLRLPLYRNRKQQFRKSRKLRPPKSQETRKCV